MSSWGIFLGLALGFGALLWAVHSIGATRLASIYFPALAWIKEITLPTRPRFRPTDFLLLAMRLGAGVTLISLWAWVGCDARKKLPVAEGCLVALDNTWSTHRAWAELTAEAKRELERCRPATLWLWSRAVPEESLDLPKEAGQKAVSASKFLDRLSQWHTKNAGTVPAEIIFITDGQLAPSETREEIQDRLESLKLQGFSVRWWTPTLAEKPYWNWQWKGSQLVAQASEGGRVPPLSGLSVECSKGAGSVRKLSSHQWAVRCPEESSPKWVRVEAPKAPHVFPRDRATETVWLSGAGARRVIVIDHERGELLRRPSFYLEKAASDMKQAQLHIQSYRPSPDTVGEKDFVLWFDPSAEDRAWASRLWKERLLVWPTTAAKQLPTTATAGDMLRLTVHQEAFEIGAELLCCVGTASPSTALHPHLALEQGSYLHRLPFQTPRLALPMSSLFPAYMDDLFRAMQKDRGQEWVRLEDLSGDFPWPVVHLRTQELLSGEPVDGLVPGVYRKGENFWIEVPVPLEERSLVVIEQFSERVGTAATTDSASPTPLPWWLWVCVGGWLLAEAELSRRRVSVSALVFALFLSPLAYSGGSQIAVSPRHAGVFPEAYARLKEEVSRRTSIDLDAAWISVPRLSVSEPLRTPFFYSSCSGSLDLKKLPEPEQLYLEKIVHLDGVVTWDGCRLQNGERLTQDHPVFRSFYLIGSRSGCGLEQVYGDRRGRLTKVLSFPPGLLRQAFVDPPGPCTEGWIRLAVNWVMFLFTSDYKNDQVHLPFLLERFK